MIKTEKRVPKFLFIRNVFKTDCVEFNDAFESKILNENIENEYQKLTQNEITFSDKYICSTNLLDSTALSLNTDYQKNPKIFRSLNLWPKSTNLHCWHCDNQFTGPPIFIPLVIEPNVHSKNDEEYSIGVDANICRWPCGMSHIKATTKDITSYVEKRNNLYFLYYIWYGKYPKHIPNAPDKYLQKKFGGELTTEEYYKLYDEIEEQSAASF